MTDMTVAHEILNQLGGRRFITMTGSSNFVGSNNSLSFKVGSNPKKITHVRIVLNLHDLYDIEFMRIWGTKTSFSYTENDVYNDQLRKTFTEYTGLYTSLNG